MPSHSKLILVLWYSNGLYRLWCCTPLCYANSRSCTCCLCGDRHPNTYNPLTRRSSTLASHLELELNKMVTVWYVL